MEYAHKVSKIIVGNKYLVAIAQLRNIYDGHLWEMPVIPHRHADPAFKVAFEHYHIDGRFSHFDASMNGIRINNNGKSNQILAVKPLMRPGQDYEVIGIKYRVRKCIQETTGIMPPIDANYYHEWYKTMLGKSCAGKKCPHFGTTMIDVDGKIYCPLHNLHADPITLKVVNPY